MIEIIRLDYENLFAAFDGVQGRLIPNFLLNFFLFIQIVAEASSVIRRHHYVRLILKFLFYFFLLLHIVAEPPTIVRCHL